MENGEQHSGRFAIIPSVALEDPRMTPTLLKLLCVMGTYGNKHGYCWPKLTTLAKRMNGVTKSAISQGLKKLHDMGYLEITPRYDTGGGRTTNMYRILYDTPDPDLNGGLAPDLNGGLAPDLNGGQVPELNTLNVPYERPTLNESSAAALSSTPREQVNGAMPEAAAAEHDENIITQTADAVRRHLRMGRDKLPGLRLIVAQYPGARPWLENQANLCYETLKVRPLQLKHFSNWLDEYERRRNAPREGMTHEQQQSAPQPHAASATPEHQPGAEAERPLSGPERAEAIWATVIANLEKDQPGSASALLAMSGIDGRGQVSDVSRRGTSLPEMSGDALPAHRHGELGDAD